MPEVPNDPPPGIVSQSLTTSEPTSQDATLGTTAVVELIYAEDVAATIVGVPAS